MGWCRGSAERVGPSAKPSLKLINYKEVEKKAGNLLMFDKMTNELL